MNAIEAEADSNKRRGAMYATDPDDAMFSKVQIEQMPGRGRAYRVVAQVAKKADAMRIQRMLIKWLKVDNVVES